MPNGNLVVVPVSDFQVQPPHPGRGRPRKGSNPSVIPKKTQAGSLPSHEALSTAITNKRKFETVAMLTDDKPQGMSIPLDGSSSKKPKTS